MSLKIKENNTIKDLAGQSSIIHGTAVDNTLSSTSENALNERVIYNELSNIDTSVTIPDLSGKMLYSSTNAIENEGVNLKTAADTVKADFLSQMRDTSSFEATSQLTAGTNVTINNNIVTGTMGSSSRCVSGTYFDAYGSSANYRAAKYAFTYVSAESVSQASNVNTIYVNNNRLGTTFKANQRLYLYFPSDLTSAYYAPTRLDINGKSIKIQISGPTGLKDFKSSSLYSYNAGSQYSTRENDPLGYDYYYDKNIFTNSNNAKSVFGEGGLPNECIAYYGSWSDSSWETAVLRQNVTTAQYIIARAGTLLELYYNGTVWIIKGNPLVASIPYYLYNMAGSSGLRFRTDIGEPNTSQYFAYFDYYANGYFELKGYIPILNASNASQNSGVGSNQPWFMYIPINGLALDKEMTTVTMQDYGSTTAENNTAYDFGTANTDVSSSTSVATATQNTLHTYNYGGLTHTSTLTQRPRLRFFHDRYTMGRFFSIRGYLK